VIWLTIYLIIGICVALTEDPIDADEDMEGATPAEVQLANACEALRTVLAWPVDVIEFLGTLAMGPREL
jgi:hypothetical protein